MPLEITYDDVNLSGKDEVSIKSHDLVNALISDPEATIEEDLKPAAASIDLSQISIDDYGTVIIKNDELKEKVKAFLLNPVRPAGDNCNCRLG